MSWPQPRLGVAKILEPDSIAVIGASQDLKKFSGRMFDNILHGGFPGKVFPVNPSRAEIAAIPAFASIGDIPQKVDVAIVAVPIAHVETTITACANAQVGCCVIITAGFSETSAEGAALQTRVVEIARSAGMRVIGPNCLGFINTHAKLLCNSSPSMKVTELRAGGIAHVSQSGALMATLYNRGVGDGAYFSSAISVGNQADLELSDFVDHFADDPNTAVVTLYVEGFRDPGRFVASVKRCVAAGKPVLMVKSGLTESGAKVTRSHTASLATNTRVLKAVCREAGAMLIDDAGGMIQAAELISRYGVPKGDGVCVISGSGGAAAITADRLSHRGLRLAQFSSRTRAALEEIYEPTQLGNPMDVGALKDKSFIDISDGGLSIAAADPDVDIILIPITTAPSIGAVAKCTAESSIASGKPALFVVMQGNGDDGARIALKELDALCYETLDEALRVLTLWKSAGSLTNTNCPPTRPTDVEVTEFTQLGGGPLSEPEAKALVASYAIPVNRESVVHNLDEATGAARELGFPVALKMIAKEISHKSDLGGVYLNLGNDTALNTAWANLTQSFDIDAEGALVCEMLNGEAEFLVGLSHDPEFGQMVMFGFGGLTTELIDDVQIAPAPISSARALELLRTLKLWPVLDGARGRPRLDVGALADTISRVSWLGADMGSRLQELDLNPVLVRVEGQGVVAVDATATIEK